MENKIEINDSNFNEMICELSWTSIDIDKSISFKNNGDFILIDYFPFKPISIKYNIRNNVIIAGNYQFSNLYLKNEYVLNNNTTVLRTHLFLEDGQGNVLQFWTLHPNF